jgi:hypothetical protein
MPSLCRDRFVPNRERRPVHYSLCPHPLAPQSGPRYSGWYNIQLRGMAMITAESTALLQQARTVLERYLFDGVDLRDDVAEICAKIDDALSPAPETHQPRKFEGIERAA